MKLFTPREEPISVVFLIPQARDEGKPVTYRRDERRFTLIENLRPQAAEFSTLLGDLGRAKGTEERWSVIDQLAQHALAHPEEGKSQPGLDEVRLIPDSEKVKIIDLQGDIYGFSNEERLEKKLGPLVEALRRSSLSPADTTTNGPSKSPKSLDSSESIPKSPSDCGPTVSLTGITASPSESSGAEKSSNGG